MAGITLVLYAPVRHFEFVNYDDGKGILTCSMIRQGLGWQSVAWAFTHRHMGNWQPLTAMSFMLDANLCRLKPAWPHIENVLFHIANSILLFLLLKNITGARWRSAFVAALFAWHPFHVESVAWVSERKDVLSTFFFLLTLMAYARYVLRVEGRGMGDESKVQSPKSKVTPSSVAISPWSVVRGPWSVVRGPWSVVFYLAAVFLFALGLMSKPMLVTVPFVLLLLDYWPLGRIEGRASSVAGGSPDMQHATRSTQHVSRLLLEKIPFFALSLAMCFITIVSQERSGAVAELSVVPLHSRLANAVVSYARYLGKTFWPRDLVVYYPRVLDWPLWQIAGAAILLAAITAGVLLLARRKPYLLIGWLWFLGTMVPVIGLMQVGLQAMADRYTYIPLIGLFILVAWGLADLFAQSRSGVSPDPLRTVGDDVRSPLLEQDAANGLLTSSPTPAAGSLSKKPHLWRLVSVSTLGAASLIACLALTAAQLPTWRDSLSLFKHVVAVYPDTPLPYSSIASALYDHEKFAEAIPYAKTALRLKPDYVDAHNTYGLCLWRLGQTQPAFEQFNAVLSQHGPDATVHYNMGLVYASQHDLERAKAAFASALKLSPDFAEAHNNLGNLLATQGDFTQAAREFQAALICAPDLPEAHYNMARCFQESGAPQKSIEQLALAVRIKPEYVQARLALAGMLVWSGRPAEAAPHYAAALRLRPDLAKTNPDLASAFDRLAAAFVQQNNFAQAVKAAEQGLRLADQSGQPRLADQMRKHLADYRTMAEFRPRP
ncbi:MAG: hypothetical protein C5B50_17890 [Verrucomicrobia bacterium]|nr:MAG: hypothetical protein C5B50_17890 [Verrucomicrobiota bacterium]